MVAEQLNSGLFLVLVLAGVPLIGSMLVGLVLSVLQAATQVQEQTLTFVPKLLLLAATLFFGGGWLFGQLEEFFSYSLSLMISLQT